MDAIAHVRPRGGSPVEDGLITLTDEHAARLAGVSLGQMRSWERAGFIKPSVERSFGPRSNVRLYGFDRLVELLVAATLVHHPGVTMSHVRTIVTRLHRRGYASPLRQVSFAVIGSEIYFRDPETGDWEGGRRPGQIVIEQVLPLDPIRAKIRSAIERDPQQSGKIERRRKTHGSKPVFAGTRVPVETVQKYITSGHSTAQILQSFPALTRADVEAAERELATR
jgi:uncharacterized protein (DUF433 family)